MKKAFFLSLIMYVFLINVIHAQSKDTTRIVTDSGIVYIIKRKPVTLKQTIEIISERLKGHYYLSVDLGILGSNPFYSVRNSEYTNYVNLLYKNTRSTPGFIQSIELIRAPRKFVWTMFFDWNHITDAFTFYYGLYKGEKNTLVYNYFRYGLRAGYWFRKTKKHSFLPSGGFSVDYLSSNTGSVVSKDLYLSQGTPSPTDPAGSSASYLKNEFQTRVISSSVLLNLKYLYRIKNRTHLELTSFTSINLINRMDSKEVFSEFRWIYGLKIGIIQNIF